MRWTRLEVFNFLSYEHFTMNLANRGLVLIEGENLSNSKFKSNGSGKSSLLEPLVYALYDTTSKGIKADDVINNKVGKNTAVILTGEKNGVEYRIERYRKHKKHKDKVLLFQNGEEITEKSVKDTNAAIEKIIGIDYNTFINSIMFSQGNGAGRFATASDREKKEIIGNLLNLGVYEDAQDVAKERMKNKELEIAENRRGYEKLEWELSQVDTLEQQDQANYQNTKNLIEQDDAKLVENVEGMIEYVNTHGPTAANLREEIEELKKQVEVVNTIDISEYTNEVHRLSSKVQEFQNTIDQNNREKKKLVTNYKKVETSTHCPVCGNELDREHRDKEMATIKTQLREILLQNQQLEAQLVPIRAEYEEAGSVYQQHKTVVDEAKSKYQSIVNEITTKESHLRSYENRLQQFKQDTENLKATLVKLRSIPEPRKRNDERKDIKEQMKAQKQALLSLERERTSLENVVKVFSNSGVKSHVLDLITPFLNKQGNKYLSVLSGPDMELKFDTQAATKAGEMRDKLDIQLINHAGGDTYKSNSEGEKKRADLSIALAIQDLVMNRADSATNFVVYDEVFDALDSVGSENVVTLLRERLDTVETILVITHNEHLKPLFEKVITVTKDPKGISTIKEGAETT